MTKPTMETELSPAVAMAIRPPIRLVQAFGEAMESSKPESDDSQEALAVELLLIASDLSFAALGRLDELVHRINYGEKSSTDLVDRSVVEDGYEMWLDAANLLGERLTNLGKHGYDSESFAAFWAAQNEARSYLVEALDRRSLERQALRTDQLVSLSAKLKKRRQVDPDQGAGG